MTDHLEVGADGTNQVVLRVKQLTAHVGGHRQLRVQQGGVVMGGVSGHVTHVQLSGLLLWGCKVSSCIRVRIGGSRYFLGLCEWRGERLTFKFK